MEPIVSENETKQSHLERLLTIKQLQINSLLEVSQAINNNFSTSALFRIYEFILRAQMGINGLLVYVKNNDWTCVCSTGIEASLKEKIVVERDLIAYRNITLLKNFVNPHLNQFDILIPVYHKDIPLAYVLIDDLKADDTDTIEEKLKFVQTITNIVMVAVENKRLFSSQIQQEVLKKELEFAAKMQAMLIPADLPNDDKIEASSVYLPHHEIGGDYFDFIKLSENDVAFTIGDISGKGIAAALLMANFQGYLRTQMTDNSDLRVFVESMNDKVANITKGDKFITLFLGLFNFETRTLKYVNAGHNPPILWNNGEIVELKTGCTLLGMFDNLPTVQIGEVVLSHEAVLLNYTDGLIDFENERGEFFSFERLYTYFETNHHLSMNSFNKKLMEYVNDFKGAGTFNDDITILSCRFY